MRIETRRLILYPMTAEDLQKAIKDLAAVVRSYGAATPYIGFWETRAKRKLYKAKSELIRQAPRSWLLSTSWLIIEREERTLIGEAGLKGPPAARHTVEIGYGLLEGFRNKGYMTEAVGALTRLALLQKDYRVERVTALTLPENVASHRVLEKTLYARQPSFGRYWLWERVKLPDDTLEGVFTT
ncbi:MAG: GNAT family N-acetyltransferase [Oscillospiraceae bacterium]|jgi:RimJ/RimL family protein N-acetyltransferase|nr:GNAT family N-acetyltransferase [Oscillospiraceae bacterium]